MRNSFRRDSSREGHRVKNSMFPFRLGTTCFIYQDDLVSNARQLADTADDIEIILYDTEKWGTNFPSAQQVTDLAAIAQSNELTYTLHLPLDLKLGDARAFDQARRAIDVTRILNPFGYVMHLDGRGVSQETCSDWQADALQGLAQLTEWVGDAARICVENVEGWNPDFMRDVVSQAGVSRCIDIGHLWKEGCDPLPHLAENLVRTRVIHLHGLIERRDHNSLEQMPDVQLLPIFEMLLKHEYRGVITLEVFSPEAFVTSRAAVLRAVSLVS
jgi:adenosylcobalamin phosphodiesterase